MKIVENRQKSTKKAFNRHNKAHVDIESPKNGLNIQNEGMKGTNNIIIYEIGLKKDIFTKHQTG